MDSTVSPVVSRDIVNSVPDGAGESRPTYPRPRQYPDPYYFFDGAIDLRYTEFKFGQHSIWYTVYNTPAMYNWMLGHATVPEPAAFTIFAIGALGLLHIRRS